MNSQNYEVLDYRIPNRPLTPLYQVPPQAYSRDYPSFESPQDAESAVISMLGAANSGKTSLVNALIQKQCFAVSRKQFTTQNAQKGIITIDNKQVIFNDTVGIKSNQTSFNVKQLGWDCMKESEFTFFVVDGVKRLQDDVKKATILLSKLSEKINKDQTPEAQMIGESSFSHFQRLMQSPKTVQVGLIVNKLDLSFNRRRVKYLISELKQLCPFQEVFFASAKTGYGIDKLRDFCFSLTNPGDWDYHPAQKLEISDVKVVQEILQAQILEEFHEEIPYKWKTRVVGWTPYLDGTLRIDTEVLVQTSQHQGMLIGRNGRAIKKLLHKSTRVLEDLYKRPIDLKIQSTLMNAAMAKAAEKGKPVNVDHPRIVSSIRLEESIHQSMLPLNND